MSVDTSNGHSAMDYAEHQRTYSGFIRLVQVSTVALVVLMVLLAAFVA
ncbi:MAG: aa3-type cytochrome c oxidase subunit IV [Hyphomicrobiaceae bacterium]